MNSYFNFKNEEEQENYNSQFKNLHCRMFENVYPRKDSLVYVIYNHYFNSVKLLDSKLEKLLFLF